MKYVLAELSAFYGCDCMGCGYSSEESTTVEVSDKIAEKVVNLLKETEGELTSEKVEELIENGDKELVDLHDKLKKAGLNMETDYWLGQAEDVDGSIRKHLAEDIESGKFVPTLTFEEYCEHNLILDTDDDYDEEEVKSEYYAMLYDNEYSEWLWTLDRDEHAKRVCMDMDAVVDTSCSKYIITTVTDDKEG